MLVALLGVPTTAGAVVYGVNIETVAGPNNRHDTSAAACDVEAGCFTTTGARCADTPRDRCDLQVVPAGRCTAGSGSCIWPQGAGTCQHDGGATPVDPVSCLTDAYLDFLRSGGPHPGSADGPSVMCAEVRGGSGICDMSSNDPTCDCTGTDPSADPANADDGVPSWEGAVCGGDDQRICSDGDPKRGIGLGSSLCRDLCTDVNCTSACNAETFEGALTGLKYPNAESPADAFTLQHWPRSPRGRVRPLRNTLAIQSDDVGAGDFQAWGLRRLRAFSNSHYFDAWVHDPEDTGTGSEGTSMVFACDVPIGQGWGPDRPVSGGCALAPNEFCIEDSDCAVLGPCDPNTFRYCHGSDSDPHTLAGEPGNDTTGFLYTRSLTNEEIVSAGAVCPPDCLTSYEFDTFEGEAMTQAAGSEDYRAGMQLFLDHLEGPRAALGSYVLALPVVSTTRLAGDSRCIIGGDPGRADPSDHRLGKCLTSPASCDPRLPIDSNGCPEVDLCLYCQGTADGKSRPHSSNAPAYPVFGGNAGFDPEQGNAEALPVGYDSHGIAALDIRGRTGVVNGFNSDLDVPLFLLFTNGVAAAEFKDNSCGGNDSCAFGEVAGGGSGIGPGFTYVDQGDPIPHEPSGPGYLVSLTIPPHNPGTPQGELLRPTDWGTGPDGIPGCFGDSAPSNVSESPPPCDELLGDANYFGDTGSDDVALEYDFSPDQDGSLLRKATAARGGPVKEAFAITPVPSVAAALAIRDVSAFGNPNSLDLVGKIDVTFCPILGLESETQELRTTCLDSDLDQDGWLDEQDGCPLNPAFATGPDTGGVASASDPGGFLPDGILDACQCGDVNDDGRVSGNDATAITRACLRLPPYEDTVLQGKGCEQTQSGPTPFVVEKCDVGGPFEDGHCSGSDGSIVKRSTLGLPPGIDLTCTAYLP